MDSLALYIDHQILLVTQDGRTVTGSLKGYDTKVNLILRGAEERIYSLDRGVETRELGLYVVKGDHVALIGLLDVDLDKDLDLDKAYREGFQALTGTAVSYTKLQGTGPVTFTSW